MSPLVGKDVLLLHPLPSVFTIILPAAAGDSVALWAATLPSCLRGWKPRAAAHPSKASVFTSAIFSAANRFGAYGAPTDVTLYDAGWRELLDDCRMVGESIGVAVSLAASWPRSTRRARARRTTLRLGAGDLYLFHSNRVHVVTRVEGGTRIVLGSFVGVSSREMRIFA